jgi:drug/metabolite transporter (DMT)-like permease
VSPTGPTVVGNGRGAGRATLALVLAAFLWGSTFLVVQDATDDAAVMPFLAARFLIGAAVLWPFARRRAPRPTEWRDGVLAGLLFLGGYVFQTVGIQYTTSSSSAFITYLLVVFVPVIDAFVLRRAPSFVTIVGVAAAIVGLVLLSGGASGFGKGEWLTLGCALCFAAHLLVLDRVTRRNDAVRLTFVQVLTVGLGCLVPGLVFGGYGFGLPAWAAALFTGVGATAVSVLCMVWAQRVVPPARTAIILLLEPVFAALLGYVAGERLGGRGFLGAGLILAAVLWTELVPDRLGEARPHHADV